MEEKKNPFNDVMKCIMSGYENTLTPRMSNVYEGPFPFNTNQMTPMTNNEFKVDVKEEKDVVKVVADLPGIEKSDISIELLDYKTLKIFCERKANSEEKSENYYIRERLYGSISRTVKLPTEVSANDTKATFVNGVLTVTLEKKKRFPEARIKIE